MTKTIALTVALLLAGAAEAHPPAAEPINDRVERLCAVSDTDLVGKRLARECRAQVRAEQLAARKTAPDRLALARPR